MVDVESMVESACARGGGGGAIPVFPSAFASYAVTKGQTKQTRSHDAYMQASRPGQVESESIPSLDPFESPRPQTNLLSLNPNDLVCVAQPSTRTSKSKVARLQGKRTIHRLITEIIVIPIGAVPATHNWNPKQSHSSFSGYLELPTVQKPAPAFASTTTSST